jgi:hypothetical protein
LVEHQNRVNILQISTNVAHLDRQLVANNRL